VRALLSLSCCSEVALTPKQIFLRGVWSKIPDEANVSWIRRLATQPPSDRPLGDLGTLVKKMLDAGITASEIARFAKLIGYETAFGIMYLLEDPHASYEGFPPEPEKMLWRLFLIDRESGDAGEPLRALHESILSMDPSGREMRPNRRE
jgi:hypothetical protein